MALAILWILMILLKLILLPLGAQVMGDLFDQAHLELLDLQKTNKPFFSLVFTSSNHDPFEIPANTISHIDDEAPLDSANPLCRSCLGSIYGTS